MRYEENPNNAPGYAAMQILVKRKKGVDLQDRQENVREQIAL